MKKNFAKCLCLLLTVSSSACTDNKETGTGDKMENPVQIAPLFQF